MNLPKHFYRYTFIGEPFDHKGEWFIIVKDITTSREFYFCFNDNQLYTIHNFERITP